MEAPQATARLAEIKRQIAEQHEQLEELHGHEQGFRNDEAALRVEWQAVWKPAGIVPLSPDDMLAWIDARAQILQALHMKDGAEQELELARDEETRARELLTKELESLGIDIAGACRPAVAYVA